MKIKKTGCVLLATAMLLALLGVSAVSAAAPAVSFVGLSQEMRVELFTEIKVEITGDVARTELYINDVKSGATAEESGGVYTFTGFEVFIGDMRITAAAYNTAGECGKATQEVQVIKNSTSNLLTADMESTITPSGLAITSHNYTFVQESVPKNDGSANMAMKALRTEAVTVTNKPYVSRNMSKLTTFQGFQFDVFFPEGANTLFDVVTRGTGNNEWPLNVTGSSNGNLTLYNGSSTALPAIAGVFQTGKWYTCRYECDPIALVYWFYVDGELKTPSTGYKFSSNISPDGVMDLRIQCGLPANGNYLYLDNMMFFSSSNPGFNNISGGNTDISAVLTEGLAGVNSNTVSLYLGSEKVPLQTTSYSADTRTIAIKTEKPLYSALEYRMVVSKTVTTASGSALGNDMVKYFKTSANDFDVTNVSFEPDDTKMGARATAQNLGAEQETIVMVMVLKGADGTIEGIYSSNEEILPAGTASRELYIAPVEAAGKNLEAFFLKGWAGSKCAKNYVYSY